MSDGTTLLFGLPGVRVERVERLADRTRVVHVATAQETAAVCPSCGVFSTSVKGRVTTSPRDIPYGEDRIVVRWNKTRWRCREDYCERSSFTEAIAQVPARARTTRRLRTQIGAAIGDEATIDTWWPEINAFVQTGITNARTEGYNRLVKQVKRSGCGSRNRENSGRRIRFHCTRKQRAATRTSC